MRNFFTGCLIALLLPQLSPAQHLQCVVAGGDRQEVSCNLGQATQFIYGIVIEAVKCPFGDGYADLKISRDGKSEVFEDISIDSITDIEFDSIQVFCGRTELIDALE